MTLALPFSTLAQRRIQIGYFVSLFLINIMGLVMIWVGAANSDGGAAKSAPQVEAERVRLVEQEAAQYRAMSRPNSVMRFFADYVETAGLHPDDDPEKLMDDLAKRTAPIVWVKGVFLMLAVGLLLVVGLGLAIYGLYRYATGPALARRWQRWQKGVVSPLPVWVLLAGCGLTVATLIALHSVARLNSSLFTHLALWEFAQAALLVGLLMMARSHGAPAGGPDFGFNRRLWPNIGGALKYYFALLPLIWAVALLGKLIYSLIDAAAGSPELVEPSGPKGIEELVGAQHDPWGIVALFLLAVFLARLMEELFFRGFLYGGLRRWLSAPAAIVVSGAVFAAMHPMDNHLPIFVLGMFLAYIYEKTGNLAASMAVHFTHNLLTTLLLVLMIL